MSGRSVVRQQRVDESRRRRTARCRQAARPCPTKRTGMPSSSAIAKTIPPLLVPSSLARQTAVTPTSPARTARAWLSRVLSAGRVDHEQHLVRRAGQCFDAITRWTLPSSAIRFFLRLQTACRVDHDQVRRRARWPTSSASYATAPGSEPCWCAITGALSRPPQVCSCSIAAARKVSAAASRTDSPSS